jgi:hypothetical protein
MVPISALAEEGARPAKAMAVATEHMNDKRMACPPELEPNTRVLTQANIPASSAFRRSPDGSICFDTIA